MIEGTPLAKCPLKSSSDEKNYLYLTDKQLIVRINGKFYPHDIAALRSIYLGRKMLLFPIVTGGLMATFSVVAYVNDLLHPWALLLFFISGVFSLFYGFSGSPAIVLDHKKSQEHYLIKDASVNLDEFVNFTNHYLYNKKIPFYYLTISPSVWEKSLTDNFIAIAEPLRLYTVKPKENNHVILKLLIENNPVKIDYLHLENNIGLTPCVTENIPLSFVSKV